LTYVKSLVAGIAALILSLCAIVAVGVATVYVSELRRAGSAGIGAISVRISVWWMVIPAIAFVAGFRWEFRRASRHSRVNPHG
jgi:predicted CDP-diglyceride synthetase/phosphatidate cytidylyltransferase